MRTGPAVALLSALISLAGAHGVLRAGTASVTLPEAAATSAGVYDGRGYLVRTLWSGRAASAGPMNISWDGRNEEGERVDSSQTYEVRVLAHNVRYLWEGVIGNTSAELSGEHVHRALNPVNNLAIDASGNAFYVVGYNEQQSGLHRFAVTDPQRPSALGHDDYRCAFRYVATDGVLAYFANINAPSFVIALNVRDDKEYRFAGAAAAPAELGWLSPIDYEPTSKAGPATGMAVQRTGDYLFVAHAGSNEIRVLDKRTGELHWRIKAAAPTGLAVAADGSLWGIGRGAKGATVTHYQLVHGQWLPHTQITADLRNPVAVAVSPRYGTVAVIDAGTEQVKFFDPAGEPQWTLGVEGGYRHAPVATTSKFWFSYGPSYLAYQVDGSLWVGDPGNARNLHYSAQGSYLSQIMYLPKSYVSTVNPMQPTRVFNGFLEFNVDYARPLRQSWSLARNWGADLERSRFGDMAGLRTVLTLSNGRTYAVVAGADRAAEVAELSSDGLRATNERLDPGTRLYPDGSLRYHAIKAGGLEVYARALAGFDAAGNPRWDNPHLLARVAKLRPTDPYYHDVPLVPAANEATYPDVGQDLIASFNPGMAQGFHLGALPRGGEGWAWRASPGGNWALDQSGGVAGERGVYDIGHGAHYGGSTVVTSGPHLIYGYHGEGWNGGQANQWLHFLANGLFVGQFGRPVYPQENKLVALPESAGNAFSPQLVTVNGELYLWHNDESVHSGVHRWRIDGADRTQTLSAAILP
ncbi:MAG: hypothetical protein JOZ67_12385 [Gammaproteobacteria bacterium]|nr:hypothetical protein [Gammaproteobacteria bacterium]